jgi:arylsulfatase A-like enzyme
MIVKYFTLHYSGAYENTLVVFTSDNGSGHAPANGRLRGKKATKLFSLLKTVSLKG